MLTVQDKVCSNGYMTLEQITNAFVSQNDFFLEKITSSEVLSRISNFLQSIQGIEVSLPKEIDMVAVFLAQDHAHLVSFAKGCSVLMYNLATLPAIELMNLLGKAL